MEKCENLILSSGASFHRGKSRQDYETPWEVVRSVEERFGRVAFDLAASESNQKGPRGSFFEIGTDSLKQSWHELEGLLWLNPPYGVIGPWARKCAEESKLGAHIAMLTPASVGSNWFSDYVHNKALVLFLSPRITFDGADDPYPKDLMLSCFNLTGIGYECWRWK